MHNFTIFDPSKHDEGIKRNLENSSTTHVSPTDDRPLLILILSLSGAGVVLVISTFFLCCYFYRTRLRRRNYPLTLTLQNNATIVTTDENSGISITRTNRPRSPVTTEADIYGFDATATRRGRREDSVPSYPTITAPMENEKTKPATGSGFENPMYKKKSSSVVHPLELPSATNSEIRKTSSAAGSVLLPGLPAMLVLDESIDDHRRLVPNDCLSMEIDRSQRWLRDARAAQRHFYESEMKANEAIDDLPSITSPDQAMVAGARVDVDDGSSKLQQAQATRKKLRRRLAEAIANDRVVETTVTFTNDIINSPATTPTPLLPSTNAINNNSLIVHSFGGKRMLDIKKKFDSDDDDLEVIFKERTPL